MNIIIRGVNNQVLFNLLGLPIVLAHCKIVSTLLKNLFKTNFLQCIYSVFTSGIIIVISVG